MFENGYYSYQLLTIVFILNKTIGTIKSAALVFIKNIVKFVKYELKGLFYKLRYSNINNSC